LLVLLLHGLPLQVRDHLALRVRPILADHHDEAEADRNLDAAEMRAEWAESDARDAVDFAANAIDEATYAMLDAILASKDVRVLLDARA